MLDKKSFKGGLTLNFLPSGRFEPMTGPNYHDAVARNIVRLLMMGWSPTWTDLLSWPVFKAIFVKRDAGLLKSLRAAFDQGFQHVFHQLKDQNFTAEQHEQVQLYLSNCLNLLPLADITPYEFIKVPQFINQQWKLVAYHVVPIELTHQSGYRRSILREHDRVFAYGLESVSDKHAQSHLIFMGTTYPAGQGFLPQINTDLKGFETAGESLYRSGKDRIKEWLQRQEHKVHVTGVSLGGALSLLLAIHEGEYIKRVDALNPPGLHDPWYYRSVDNWDHLSNKPQVVIQQQANDPVSPFGIWKKEWEVLNVIPPLAKQGPNAFCDHFLNYAGFAQTQFTYVDVQQANQERKARNVWLYSIGRGLVYYSVLMPFSFVTRPILNYCWDQRVELSLALAPLTVLGGAIALTMLGFISALVLIMLVSMLSLAISTLTLISGLKEEAAETPQPQPATAQLHSPDAPRNRDLDIYNKKNKIAIELTHKETLTYYRVIRNLIKPKEAKKDKNELLATCQEESKLLITLHKIPAKAKYMKQTLHTFSLFANQPEHLKTKIRNHYAEYSLGKK